jgi:hypothetical protein
MDGTFCCSDGARGYNITSKSCLQATHGSNDPFDLPIGHVIYNRTSGSTAPNSTVGQTVTVFHTVTATPESPAPLCPSPTAIQSTATCHEAAIGAGIAVPLVVLLILACALLWRQSVARRKLEGQLQQMQIQHPYPVETTAPVNELQSAPVHEMDANKCEE